MALDGLSRSNGNLMPVETLSATDPMIKLRFFLLERGLAALLVPRSDAFLGNALRARDEQLAWASGFTGSAGFTIVTADRAVLVTDSRYTDQARGEVDLDTFDVLDVADTGKLQTWLVEALSPGDLLGYIPALHAIADVTRWGARLEHIRARLAPLGDDPFDHLWPDRPLFSYSPAVPYDLALSGRNSADKRCQVGKALSAAGLDAVVLTTRETNAWLFNIRGGDVANTPVADAVSLLRSDGSAILFLNAGAVGAQLDGHLGEHVTLKPLGELEGHLAPLVTSLRVLLDPEATNACIGDMLAVSETKIMFGPDPCLLPKARKNTVEVEHSRRAHKLDGVALVRFLSWLEGALKHGEVSELAAEEALLAFRSCQESFSGPSFPTISAAGPNAAIAHYRATADSSRLLSASQPYLVDSGGQYTGATTDVTRTIAIGEVTPDIRTEFTAVARGHIALAQARFPAGTTGGELDFLARQHLRRIGLDYGHSTGHGVGAYLNVHEGPQRIRRGDTVPLEPGMIVSNEPGFYLPGSHGMRLENLMVVRSCSQKGASGSMLEFETLTLAPVDRQMLDKSALAPDEVAWIDDYHAAVAGALLDNLEKADRAWLVNATRPLAADPVLQIQPQ